MTSQTKRYIELADILTLKLSCKGCGSSLEIPISRDISGRADSQKLSYCPICQKPWANLGGATFQPLFAGFGTAVQKLTNAMQDASRARQNSDPWKHTAKSARRGTVRVMRPGHPLAVPAGAVFVPDIGESIPQPFA